MSKNFQTRQAARETIKRVRTYGAFVRTQRQGGWASDATTNGRLTMTAMAGASA